MKKYIALTFSNTPFLNNYLYYTLFIAILSLEINAQTFPAGFSQLKVGTIYYPTSMAFAPDGRIFASEKSGKVKIIKNGVVLSTPFLSVSVNQLNERGLSCVAIDPDFNTNHYVYIYYTTASSPIHNRLSRFVANGDVAGSEEVIMDFDASINSIHNGGGMEFDPDGTLYLAVGNDNVNSYSQDLSTYKGKVLRINTDGSIPPGNPFTSGSEAQKRIWSYGLRNPWSLAIQSGTNKLFANDVGEGAWEEINDITTGGKNYGWPGSEGMTSNPAYTNPIYAYPHGSGGSDDGCAITGGTFFNPANTNYPSQYTGKYFFIDYCNDWINYLDVSTHQKSNFATSLPGSENYLKVGPDGNLYYFSISTNSLYKIVYSNSSAPTVTSHPSNVSIAQGQNATFNVSASGASPLTYKWQKGTSDISGSNSSSYTINNVQTADAGQYRVMVSNNNGSTTSNYATLSVTSFNSKPVAVISSPSTGTFYRNGDDINFSGTATDAEDGTLSASAFNWIVEFHHNNHAHPGPDITPGVKNGTFNTTFGETSAYVFFRLILVVTDSQGLTDSAHVDIHPITANLTFNSQPTGLTLLLEEQPHTVPYSVLAVSGMSRSIAAPSPQTLTNIDYEFDHWLHGGSASQNVMSTDNDQTFTAVFKTVATGVNNAESSLTGLKAYPNPNNGRFTIELNVENMSEEKVNIRLLNVLGKEIYSKDFSAKGSPWSVVIETEETIPDGIYTLQLLIGDKVNETNISLTRSK